MKFLFAFFSFFVLFLFDKGRSLFAQNPNIILILADDLGYGDLGCYGCTDIKTPNIDKLSTQGVRFTSFYANGPECSPTRTALLTGRYQQRVGGLECAIGAGNVGRYNEAIWLSDKKELGLPAEQSTLPLTLQMAGYKTAIIGKWHLGYEKKFRPNMLGFDYSFGPIGYGGDYFYHVEQVPINQSDFTGEHNLAENGKEVFRNGEYMTELITKIGIDWLKQQNKNRPFFLYLPFTSPHDPYQGPNDKIGRPLQGSEWTSKSREKYIEMVEAMDKGIGILLSTLEQLNLEQETIILFFSDNGGTKIANNGILSGYKGQVYEGGIRVPCIIRWPGKIAENSLSDQTAISFDLTNSLIKLSGCNIQDLKSDGYDIISHITQKRKDFDRSLYWRIKRDNKVRKAVRVGDFKYLVELENDTVIDEKMFNIKNDPSEQDDLLKIIPKEKERLRKDLFRWENEVTAIRLNSFKSENLKIH